MSKDYAHTMQDDLIRRSDAIEAIWKLDKDANEYVVDDAKEIHGYCTAIGVCVGELSALPSSEPPYQYSEAYVNQLRGERDILQDMVNNMAEPKTGEWIEVEVFPEVYDIEGVKTWGSEMQCDQCGFRHTAIEGHMAQYNFCPNCGAKMFGEDGEA